MAAIEPILHDAHVLEGGKTYTVVKTLITGSVRGQSLEETLSFMQKNVLGANKCYLPETIKMCNEMSCRRFILPYLTPTIGAK